MNDLDRQMRALLDEDARKAPPVPVAAPALRRTRRRQVLVVATSLAMVAAVAIGSLAGVSALMRTSGRRIPTAPGETPAPVGGFSCPPGSTPDQPGPADGSRPTDIYAWAATTFDPVSGRMLLLSAEGAFWTFDVCANTWQEAPGPEGIRGGLTELVYDVDSDRTIAIERASRVLQVWTCERDGRTWTEKGQWAVGAIPEPMFSEPLQATYDPVTGLVLVRDQFTSAMWTYDVDADTWSEVDQGTILPPVVEGTNDPPVELLTYDAAVDRLILYVTKPLSTWEFDIRTGSWLEQETDTPENPGFGWVATGEELTYDEASEVSVLFGAGTLATYDASAHRWTVLQGPDGVDTPGETKRNYFAMTSDPVNGRIVVAGGDVWIEEEERWAPTDDVIAFDVATREWVTLLEPTAG
jgi:hypothetical protein